MSLRTRIFESMRTTPRRFQMKGIKFIHRRGGRALVGDDMGLGKTFQTAGWMAVNPDARPVLIVCPASLKYNWQRELSVHAGIDSFVCEGMRPTSVEGNVWIINYDIIHAWRTAFEMMHKPVVLVLDECQKIKERTTKRSKACDALAKQCEHVIGLSGTPITNRPVEFFPILHMIAPQLFPSFTEYAFRYCNPKQGWQGRGWDYSGASNLDELHERVSAVMIRRMKSEVLKELPPKSRTIVPIKITNRVEYDRAVDDFIEWYSETEGLAAAKRAMKAQALIQLSALKRLAAEGKLQAIIGWAGDWLEETPGKLVLFTTHKRMMRHLMNAFPTALRIDGTVISRDRQAVVDAFQNDPSHRLLIGNLKAAGEGLTLTASSTVAFTELGWTPAEHDQAEDRVLRIGQTADRVDAYYFIGQDTVEEETLAVINQKRGVVSQILDGSADAVGVSVQFQVIEKLLKKGKLLCP